MSEELPSSEAGGDVLRTSLGEIRQSLDAIAEHVHRLEVERVTSAPPSRPPASESSEERDARSVGQEILAIPSAGLEPAQVFSLAMDRVARLLSADRAMLFVWEPDSVCLRARAGRGFRRDDLDTISIKAGEGLIGQAFQNEGI